MTGRELHRNLFEAARRGDEAAQLEISRIVHGFARLICRGGGPLGAPDVDWQDVAQEALRKFFATGIHAYRSSGAERSYLYTVVKTTVIEMSRAARRRRAREDAAARTGVATDNPGHALDVEKILSRLPEECRRLVERAFLHGEPYDALARSMGLEESSVRAKLSRCIRKARLHAGGGDGA